MKLTGQEAQDVVYEDHEDWQVVETETVGNSRWSVHKESICIHVPTGEHYLFSYSVGATEYQEEHPFEYEKEVTPVKVVQKEVVRTEWVPDED